ncbi:MAG: hypothetical protein HFH45_02360 [Bacilli bacterium]|nr:hypothetical protein [Bacilli bacterium]
MNAKKSNKNRNIIIGTVVGVVLLIIGFIGYIVIGDLKQEDILRNEIKIISEKDVTKDRYNNPIKTKEDYAVVEKAIKEYLDDYAVTLQNVMKIIEDKTIINMLTADNYQKDGPDFKTSKEFLTNTKKTLSEGLTKLSNMTSTETVMKNIEDKKLDKYYNDLYKELMLNGIAEKDFETAKQYLQTAGNQMNNLLNVEEQVIDLLIANKGKWKIENGKIVFQETATLNKYNELCNKLG